jgi:hypothetical protein
MSNITNTKYIVDRMETLWSGISGGGTFHFGLPQEIDNIHNKRLPAMIVYPPTCQMKMDDIKSNFALMNCQWELVIYDNIPSTYEITDDKKILALWDEMENKLLSFYSSLFNTMENNGVIMNMTSPLQITRLQNATNDQLLGIKFSFGSDFFRACFALK